MNKSLILCAAVAAVTISACSQKTGVDPYSAYNSPQYSSGQYNMDVGQNPYAQTQYGQGQFGQMQMGDQFQIGSAYGKIGDCSKTAPVPEPVAVPTCQQPVKPCAVSAPVPVSVPCPAMPTPCARPVPAPVSPCARTRMAAMNAERQAAYGGAQSGYGYMQGLGQAYTQSQYGQPQYDPSQYGLRGGYMNPRESYFYGEVGAVNYDIGKSSAGLQSRLGYQSKHIVGAEIESSFGVLNRKHQASTGGGATIQDLGVESSMAGFAVARMAVNPTFSALARIGYHSTKEKIYTPGFCGITSCTVGFEDTRKSDGLAIGAGVEGEFSPNNVVRMDVTGYDLSGGYNTAVSLGYQRKF